MIYVAASNRGVTLIGAGLGTRGNSPHCRGVDSDCRCRGFIIKVNPRMPHRRPPTTRVNGSPPARRTFHQRYDALEARRDALVVRLHRLGENGQQHPGYKRALKLLNDTYRKSKLAQRLAVLQAAAWLIDLIEQVTTVI